MILINKKVYIHTLVISILALILMFSSIVYYKIQAYDSNRIYNLRKVDTKYRAKLMEDYIDRIYKQNSILIIGDSQPNGHQFPDSHIFSTLLEKHLQTNVINLAFQDSRILDNIFILNYCHKKNYNFKNIIFNINHSHIKQSNFQHIDLSNRVDWKIKIYSNLKSFYDISFNPNPTSIPKEKLHLAKYKNYFDMNSSTINEYMSKVQDIVKLSKKLTKSPIIYLTPHPTNAVLFNNKEDIDALKIFNSNVLDFCQKKSIHCFEPNIFNDEYFIDIVHFNSLGHVKMTNILVDKIKKSI